ncbi:MFS transporter [Terrihabitans soli]|uniref:MFS transporter n=1 Tax=Terrihabitans soli TaxID=708113 RepID=A0A6S6QRC2_9HYPH|nr:MFS transporter [Terrihabitans soli]BCJ89601.1 MFS transporter [Terrihabitans soli]
MIADEDQGLPAPKRHIALAALLITIAIGVIDASSINVVLPHIARTFGVSPAEAILAVTANQIAMVAMLLPCASLAEKIGLRRMLTIGLVLFVVSSIVCFFARSMPELLIARTAAGFSGACIFATTTALVRISQPVKRFGRTMGTVATVVAVSTGLGPAIATAIVAKADWIWIFAPNIVFGLIALVMVRSLPVVRDRLRPVNLVSAVLCATTFSLLIVGIGNAVTRPAIAAICVVLGLAACFALLRRERSSLYPMLPVDLLRLPPFANAVAGAACLFLAQMTAFVALPFYLHGHFDSVQTGALLTVWPIAVALTAPVAGMLSDKLPPHVLCATGAGLLATGLTGLVTLPPSALVLIVPALAMCGSGFGLFQTPNNRAMLLAVPRNRIGAAGGMQATTRQFGQALGASAAALGFTLSATLGGTISLSIAAGVAFLAFLISISPNGRDRA